MKKVSQVVAQQQGGVGNIKRNPSKMGGQGSPSSHVNKKSEKGYC